MESLLSVAIGGGVGSVARYITSVWAANRFGAYFPYGTFIVNVAGCYVIGLLMILFTEKLVVSTHLQLLLTTGFLGGLTTFSSFTYETIRLVSDGSPRAAAANIAANLFIGLLATWGGIMTARCL